MRWPREGFGCCRGAAASIARALEIVNARSEGGVGEVNKLNLRRNERSSIASSRHTGQRSRCPAIATRTGRETQSSTYCESDCLVSSHNIGYSLFPIFDCQLPEPLKSAIKNRQSAMSGWLANPGCSLSTKSNSDKFWATRPGLSERASTGVAGHVFNTPFEPLRKPF